MHSCLRIYFKKNIESEDLNTNGYNKYKFDNSHNNKSNASHSIESSNLNN